MILHITNDYSGSTVYKNLIGELDNLGIDQIVYNPIKSESSFGKNKIELKVNGSEIIYSNILNKMSDRIFYRSKIGKILKDIEEKIDITKIKMIHAHTWYSDGGVAYLLSIKYNIPYIITIRNTDLNIFQKYLIHERGFGRRILQGAKNVILIAASYRNRVLQLDSLSKIKDNLSSKIQIIPNGVDAYWINNIVEKKVKNKNHVFNILFVGKFTKGKNILQLQSAVLEINKMSIAIHLHLIGGEGSVHQKVLENVKSNPDLMTYHGKIYDLSKLKGYFGLADIFAMPSSHETFGLVYVEAMLQGLPILYTNNEGVDGFYDEKIGEKVFSINVEEIKDKLLLIMRNYDLYTLPVDKLVLNHDWKKIVSIYKNIYYVNR